MSEEGRKSKGEKERMRDGRDKGDHSPSLPGSVKLWVLCYKHTRKCPLADRGRKGERTEKTEWMNALQCYEKATRF